MAESPDLPREFVCKDCNIHVTTFVPKWEGSEDDLCATCVFLRCVPDPEERERLRKHLQKPY